MKTDAQIKAEELTKNWHEAAVQAQSDMGLFILKTLILLNGGGLVLLLTLLSSTNADAAFSVDVSAIKQSATGFLVGIVCVLITAVISYATALFSDPYTGQADIPLLGHRMIEPAYFLFGIFSIVAFIFAVSMVIGGVSAS